MTNSTSDLLFDAMAEEISQHDMAFYADRTEAHNYTNKVGQTMPYRLFLPREYDPKKQYPLVLLFHGDKDGTVPTSGSQDMVNATEKVGGTKIKISIYKGEGHESCEKPWREKELIEWVFNQKKLDNKPDASDGK